MPRNDSSFRFAILLSPVGVYGRERLLLGVAARLLRLGHAVDVLLPGPRALLGESLPAGARLVELDRWWMRTPGRGWHSKHRTYLSAPLVAAYLRRVRPHVLLSGSIPPNLVALAARRLAGVPTRLVLRQSNVVRIPGDPHYGDVRRRLRDPLVRGLYTEADAVVAVSHGVADNVVKATGLPPGRVRAVQAGVADTVAEMAREDPGHPWFAPGAPPVVLNVGRLVPKKDQATLLRAFDQVRRTRPANLLILGPDGPGRAELESLIAELDLSDCVELAGFSANPYAYMARAGVFVLSSVSEGMPNALLEALACGCPVVSTDCPSGPREILDGGAYGRLVPMRDPVALANAIEASLDEAPDRDRLRARAADFGVERAVGGYVEVLLAVAADNGGRLCNA